MPHEQAEAAAIRNDPSRGNILTFVAVGAAMAVLAGCAVAVPLRGMAPSDHVGAGAPESNFICADRECSSRKANSGAASR